MTGKLLLFLTTRASGGQGKSNKQYVTIITHKEKNPRTKPGREQQQSRSHFPIGVNFPGVPLSPLLCEFCSWVTVAMKGCWAMWLGDCCMSGCWCGLCSCCENCTGCRAAKLPATLLMTGTLCACEVFRPGIRERAWQGVSTGAGICRLGSGDWDPDVLPFHTYSVQ